MLTFVHISDIMHMVLLMGYKYMLNSPDECFIKDTYRFGSITKAAEALGISQPALSMKLSHIEKKLGFQVFNRRTTPLSLTDEGAIYLTYLNKKAILETECQRRITEISDIQSKTLTIGAPTVYIRSILINAVTRLHHMHPDYLVTIKSESVPELIEMTNNAEIDCFIATSQTDDACFINTPIRKERTYLCVPHDHPLNERLSGKALSTENIYMLNGESMIFLQPNQPLQITLDNLLQAYHLDIHPCFIVNQVVTALELTEQGVGVCLATGELLDHLSKQSSISTYSLQDMIPDRTIFLSYPKNRYIPKACIDFIDLFTNKEESK